MNAECRGLVACGIQSETSECADAGVAPTGTEPTAAATEVSMSEAWTATMGGDVGVVAGVLRGVGVGEGVGAGANGAKMLYGTRAGAGCTGEL